MSMSSNCVYNVGKNIYNLHPWANNTIYGPKASGGRFAASFCGELAIKCEDALTHHNLSGAVYQYFGSDGEWLCWDVLVPTATPATALASERGLTLKWSHHGDAHLSCPVVNVTARIMCDFTAPQDPSQAVMFGSQKQCSWNLVAKTSHSSVCTPFVQY